MAYNGTLTGTTSFVAGPTGYGQALSLAATGSVSIPSNPGPFDFGPQQSWTAEARFLTSDAGHNMTLMAGPGWSMGVFFGGATVTVAGVTQTPGPTPYADGAWHTMALVVRNGARAELYVDGALIYAFAVTFGSPTLGSAAIGTSWNGLIDECVTATGALYPGTSGAVYPYNYTPASAPFAATRFNQIALYHLDGDATDANTSVPSGALGNYPGIASGTTSYGTAAAGYGNALSLAGTGYVSLPPRGPLDFPSGAGFCIEARINTTNTAAGSTAVVGLQGSYWLGMTGGKLAALVGGSVAMASSLVINDGAWHTIALICRQGTGFELWLDGTIVMTNAASHVPNPGGTAQIGAYGGANQWSGLIDEVAAFRGACYRGPTAYTAPTAPFSAGRLNQVALYHLDADPTDSNTALPVTSLGNYPVSALGGAFVTSSHSGFGSELTLSGATTLPAGVFDFDATESWTAEAWVKTTATGSVYEILDGTNWRLVSYFGNLYAGITGSGGFNWVTSSASLANGAWHHVALCVHGGLTFTLYLDGVDVTGAQPGVGRFLGGSGTTATIGSNGLGDVDEVAVSRGLVYTGAFTPPSAPFANNRSGQIALYHFDGNGNESNTAPPPGPLVTLDPTDASLVYSPFNWHVTAGSAKTVNSGAYLKQFFTGVSCALQFDVSALVAGGVALSHYPYIMARIDGGNWLYFQLSQNSNTLYTLTPTLLANQQHFLEVVVRGFVIDGTDRWSTPVCCVVLSRLVYDDGATVFAAPAKRPANLLVFGDSITEGVYTNYPNLPSDDVTLDYSWQLYESLPAEVGIVGFSGHGWINGATGGVPALPSTYNLLWSGQSRSFSAPAPDLVVYLEGQNDGPQTDAAVTSAVETVINGLLVAAPQSKHLLVGPLSQTKAAAVQAAATALSRSAVVYQSSAGWTNMTTDTADGLHPIGSTHLGKVAPPLAAAAARLLPGSGGGVHRVGLEGGL